MIGVVSLATGFLMLVLWRVTKRTGERVWQVVFATLGILYIVAGFAYLILVTCGV